MNRRKKIGLWLILICLLITGCNGAKESDGIAYALLVGVDRDDDNQLEYTFQIAIPRGFGAGSGSSPKDAKEATVTLAITANSFAEARDIANSTVARTLNLSHVKGFLIGEKVAREGIEATLPALPRFREYRGSMFLMVIKDGTAKDFIADNNPKLEVLPSRYIETMMGSAKESSTFLASNIHEYFVRLKSSTGSPYVTLAANNLGNKGKEQHKQSQQALDRTNAYTAGQTERDLVTNPAEFLGVAVFQGDKMVGVLDNKQTRGLAILESKFGHGFFVVADPVVPQKAINLEVEEGRKPKITVDLIDGQARIAIDVFMEAEITAIGSDVNYEGEGYRQQLEEEVSKVIQQDIEDMLAVTQPLGSDVAGLGYYLRPKLGSYQELLNLNWPELYRNAETSVKVVTRVRRTGLMIKTSPDDPKERRK
jgi:Ger(x)C family germination protein